MLCPCLTSTTLLATLIGGKGVEALIIVELSSRFEVSANEGTSASNFQLEEDDDDQTVKEVNEFGLIGINVGRDRGFLWRRKRLSLPLVRGAAAESIADVYQLGLSVVVCFKCSMVVVF